ncbi:MAG: NADH-quinone oxidoreductase subunit N [Desulfuromonadales bacterium]|nr:MAG: NADH-quinone oxidoreductase subunit N [Desulfuromonadales bacterium]
MAADLLYGLLPEHLLLGLIFILMLLDMFRANRQLGGALFAAVLAVGSSLLLYQLFRGYSIELVPSEIVIDRFALLGRLVILGCGLVFGLCSLMQANSCKYWILLVSSLLGALIIMDSAGFASLFIGIEMLSLPAFALMVSFTGSAGTGEGAFKYLLLSSVASALILFGISLAYGVTGSLAIRAFAASLSSGGVQNLTAAFLVLSGFFLKGAVFPFHAWAPDAYAGARLQVTAFLASLVKGAVVLGLARILTSLLLNGEIVATITVLSLASIFYGNIAAIRQTTFKRLLAYSSIAHAGYMMFALADSTGARVEALLYYVSVYALTTIIACTCFSLISHGEGDSLDLLDGAFATHPVPAGVLALAVLSMAGIPPLPGFLAKVFIFKNVVASGLLLPSVLAFLGSYFGAVFYLSVAFRLFSTAPAVDDATGEVGKNTAWGGVLLGTALLTLFTLVPGIFNLLL